MMNTAVWHVQSPQQTTKTSNNNVLNSIMNFLPDNRPITSLQIVEEYEKCPKNFTALKRTYDQDSDADLWRETVLFGRQTSRYLCLSKTEGLPDYVVETLKIISEKEAPPKEFSLLSRTADSEQKAWRKKQIIYKLSKRGTVKQAVTDIIMCSKLKVAPEGFKLAGEINGILVCYKTGIIPVRMPPPVPTTKTENSYENEMVIAMNRSNLSRKPPQPLPQENDYEEIRSSYKLKPATSTYSTIGTYSELEGVPFIINPNLVKSNQELPKAPTTKLSDFEYDFHMERQILCTMKSSSSTNPFFK